MENPNDEYFSDGLAEEITNVLAQIPGLKVIARTSAFVFKGKDEDIRTIAQVLGVGNVLEGSVRRSGPRVRVTVQLIRAADGSHCLSKRYEREVTDVFCSGGRDLLRRGAGTALPSGRGEAAHGERSCLSGLFGRPFPLGKLHTVGLQESLAVL